MTNKCSKGRYGEDLATKYLLNLGYKIEERNYRNKLGEIDIICRDKGWLVFVEVKYKQDDKMGFPEEMIDRNKIGQVMRVARLYLIEKQLNENIHKIRIDAICIQNVLINYYKNICE